MGLCVHVRERDRDPEIDIKRGKLTETEKKREMQTHKQNAPSFKPQLGVFDDGFFVVFFSSTSQSLPCEESNYMSRTSPH